MTFRTRLARLGGYFLSLYTLCIATSAHAQLSHDIKANGVSKEIVVDDSSITQVRFTTSVKGTISQYLDVKAEGPAGIRGYVEIRQKKNAGRLGPIVRLKFPKRKKGFTTELNDGKASSAIVKLAAEGEPTPEQIARIKKATGLNEAVIKILFKAGLTEEEIIARYSKTATPTPIPGATPTPYGDNPNQQSAQPGKLAGRGMLNKDACDPSAQEYQITFVVDLQSIDRLAAGERFTLSASIDALDSEPSPATLKPVSEGKYGPQPLFLLSSLGYSFYGNSSETLALIKWKNGRPGAAKSIKIQDYVFYRGQRLARAIAGGHLNGGKGTLEISNGSEVGTACFNLVRARQRVNGYKGGE